MALKPCPRCKRLMSYGPAYCEECTPIVQAELEAIKERNLKKKMQKYNFPVSSKPVFIITLVFLAVIIGAVAVILSLYRGLSWTIVIVAAVVLAYNFLMEKTRLGRHIYGVGGNADLWW